MLSNFMDYLGLLIGLGFVILATVFLPARVRWYVFTAGIAVVAFRAYQLWWARGRLKELDQERKQLQGDLQDLRSRHDELEKLHQQLTTELDEVRQQRDELVKQREALDENAANFEAEKKRLDTKLETQQQKAKKLREDTKPLVDFLESFADAERLTANVPENI
jgi:chromosome segregation ATPase